MAFVQAEVVGTRARARLARPQFAGRAIAVVSGAIYLQDDEGEILWISPTDAVPHRRAILAPWGEAAWQVGTRCLSKSGVLRSDRGDTIHWIGAHPWEAPTCRSAAVPAEGLAPRFVDAFLSLSQRERPGGLAGRLAQSMEVRRGLETAGAGHLQRGWPDLAAAPLSRLALSSRAHSTKGLLEAARGLVGLGEGLTPSGDDFLGGFLFALGQLERSGASAAWLDWRAVESWLPTLRALTNPISLALLADLAQGHGPEPLHSLFGEGLTSGRPEALVRQAGRLVRIGQSTGWDILAGVVVAWDAGPLNRPGIAGDRIP